MIKNYRLKSEEKRLVVSEVYVPGDVDLQGDMMSVEQVEKMAFEFMKNQRTGNVDVNHDFTPSGAFVVESWIARPNDPDGFREGAWAVTIHIPDDTLWAKVKSGDLNALSMAGKTKTESGKQVVSLITGLDGFTEKSACPGLPEHRHPVSVAWKDGEIGGKTEIAFDHDHDIISLSATGETLGHAHRLVVED